MAKTKYFIENPNISYEPSRSDILSYAHSIGIDPKTESHLLWIAKQGLLSPVPDPWLILADEKDRIYYYNRKSRQSSWIHPTDIKLANLVQEEKTKSKSLNSTCSDLGLDSKRSLEPIQDDFQAKGSFSKAPLPQLSSLADAPPLSSGGKDTPSFPPQTKTKNEPIGKKIEIGRFENRRGTQLSAVKLNSLKMPVPSMQQRPASGVSFMPKGSSLTRTLRRPREEPILKKDNRLSEVREKMKTIIPSFDMNNSDNSEEVSKYSYEDSDYEDENIHEVEEMMNRYDPLDASPLSPIYSADGSPEPMDVNSLVLHSKMPNKLDIPKQLPKMQSLSSKNQFSLLTKRSLQDQYSLKPIQKGLKPKSGLLKKAKISKKSESSKAYSDQTDISSDIPNYEEAEEGFQDEWKKTLERLEKEEAMKFEELIGNMSKKLDTEEAKLSKENEEKISKLQLELSKQFHDEEELTKNKLEALQKANKEKLSQEEERLNNELNTKTHALEQEIKEMEQKKQEEISKKKAELEKKEKEEMENLWKCHETNVKSAQETHQMELSIIEKSHQEEIKKLQKVHMEKLGAANKDSDLVDKFDMKDNLKSSLADLKKLIKEEEEKYQALKENVSKIESENKLLKEQKEQLKSELAAEKTALSNIMEKKNISQSDLEQLQEETERLENDSELLRNEKSVLISEIHSLKENMKKQNSVPSTPKKSFQKENTVLFKSTACQAGIDSNSVSCQMNGVQAIVVEVSSQTNSFNSMSINSSAQTDKCSYGNKSCQADVILHENENKEKVRIPAQKISENSNVEALINKNLETALGSLKHGIDDRIKSMEDHLRVLQEKLSSPLVHDNIDSNPSDQRNLNNIFEGSFPYNGDGRNQSQNVHSSPNAQLHSNTHLKTSSQSCKCELGNSRTCNIMEDLKNSVYNLNHIVNRSFSTSFVNPYGVNLMPPPIFPHTSSLQGFYRQYRDLQDRKSAAELHFKSQGGFRQSGPSQEHGTNGFNTSENGFHSALSSQHMQDDPTARARSIVLREQARLWKQQQQLMTSSLSPQNENQSEDRYDSIYASNLSTAFTILPSFESPYEHDEASDYDTWMCRLNALQQRIRNHNHKLV